mgnify:FL=1
MRHSRSRGLVRLVWWAEGGTGREEGGRAARRGGMDGAAAGGVGGTGAGAFARLSSRPPDSPVTSRVVPTESRKTSVYFLDESRLERRVNGLDDVGAGADVASGVTESGAVELLILSGSRVA